METGDFWDFGRVSWCEVAMVFCFGVGWLASVAKTLRIGRPALNGFSSSALALLGFLFGVAYKLFNDLDVVILLYAFFAIVAFSNLLIGYTIRRAEAESARVEARKAAMKRRDDLSGDVSTEGRTRSRRRSGLRRAGASFSESSSEEARSHSRSHSHSHSRSSLRSHSHSRSSSRGERDITFDSLEPQDDGAERTAEGGENE